MYPIFRQTHMVQFPCTLVSSPNHQPAAPMSYSHTPSHPCSNQNHTVCTTHRAYGIYVWSFISVLLSEMLGGLEWLCLEPNRYPPSLMDNDHYPHFQMVLRMVFTVFFRHTKIWGWVKSYHFHFGWINNHYVSWSYYLWLYTIHQISQ